MNNKEAFIIITNGILKYGNYKNFGLTLGRGYGGVRIIEKIINSGCVADKYIPYIEELVNQRPYLG